MLERLLLQCEKYPLDFVSHLSSSLPLLIGVIRYKYLQATSKIIAFFFLFYFLKETVALWLSLHVQNNLYIQNIESVVEIWILLAAYLYCFASDDWRRIGVIAAIACSAVAIYTYEFQAISIVSLSSFRLFAIFFCLSYFTKILAEVRVKNVLLHTMFWFVSGLLVYATGTFFIVLFSKYWYDDISKVPAEVFDKYWNVIQILFTVFALLSAIGLWFTKRDRENFT